MAILAEQRTYVGGKWVTGDDVVSVENPADETHVGDVTVTPLREVERAIAEARRSFDEGVVGRPARRRPGRVAARVHRPHRGSAEDAGRHAGRRGRSVRPCSRR